MERHTYLAIDLKSFYASVECVERGLNPLNTNLVVADVARTEKTICLAVSPSLKAFGVPARPRLFEAQEKVRQINKERQKNSGGRPLQGSSWKADELQAHTDMAVDFLIARPQMQKYLECSRRIYQIYLNYVSPEDIHVYSVDEVFIDVTRYLDVYGLSASALARRMIQDVLDETGITATAGIGTNLYLAKVAMDIVAKHLPGDKNGVRMAALDEIRYREILWTHEPLTDFWRIGHGLSARLNALGIRNMGDLARFSLSQENLLFKVFGIQAELLVDHAWGVEPVTIKDIKAYRPQHESLSQGQVLLKPYSYEKGALVLKEMADQLSLDLVENHVRAGAVDLYVGFDRQSLNTSSGDGYEGPVGEDWYGRRVPQSVHGMQRFPVYTSSSREITAAVMEIYERIVDPLVFLRNICLTAVDLQPEEEGEGAFHVEQLSLEPPGNQNPEVKVQERAREKKAQEAILRIKKKYGNNAILRGMDLEEDAMSRKRNRQVGGHRK
jgi:DNA polymerase V